MKNPATQPDTPEVTMATPAEIAQRADKSSHDHHEPYGRVVAASTYKGSFPNTIEHNTCSQVVEITTHRHYASAWEPVMSHEALPWTRGDIQNDIRSSNSTYRERSRWSRR